MYNPPGVVTRDREGEGWWSHRGLGAITGLRVKEDGNWITHISAR